VIVQQVDSKLAIIDTALQTALDKIIDQAGTVSYQSKPLNEIASERPNTGNINMNGK
jgi:hypothetical protein